MNIHRPTQPTISENTTEARYVALVGVPMIKQGDDLGAAIVAALAASDERLFDDDVLVLAQKIVSKAEGRTVRLDTVDTSAAAHELAREVNKDPRLVELILRESSEVLRKRPGVLIVAHRLGFVMANAGIDMSNVEHREGDDTALLLPEDPDASCSRLRISLKQLTGADVGVIVNDSHGRAFRNGTVGVAIGASGIPALMDRRGECDLFGRTLQHTVVGVADEIASAASLLMGQAGEGKPIVLARGVATQRRDGAASELVRPRHLDLFRAPTGEMLLRSRRSIRRYQTQAVPDDILQTVLESAVLAPSAHNRQPWRFAVIRNSAVKHRLATEMGARLRADRERDGDNLQLIEKDVARSFARLDAASVVIIVCLTMQGMDEYPDPRRSTAEHQMAIQGTAMATQNLLLAAHAAGLGANIMCAPLFCPDTVRAALALPDDWEPQGLVTLGYPDSAGRPLRRNPLAEIVRIIEV